MLPNLEEKHKEKPLCYPYSVKARALLHAHFNRLELSQNTLEIGKFLKEGCKGGISAWKNVK